ncbi:MAG: hypothetical protein HOM11_06560 [Methylococcales bacterium]|jgi:hypothetical protein|nr:hypothetical protein [Methylococcales bacterium]
MNNELPVPLPESLDFIQHTDYIEIVRSWYGWHVYLLAFFCLMWDGFLVVWYSNAISEGDLIMFLFPLLHLAAGVGITYYTVATWLNKTYIYVSKTNFVVFHKPLPWFGKCEIPVNDLKQLYVKEKVRHNKNGTSVSYELHAILQSGKNKKLVTGLSDDTQALFIEQAIEQYLDIQNQPVKGEY